VRDLRDPFIRSALKQAERSTPLSNLEKLTQQKNGSRHFIFKKDSLWEIEGKARKAVLHALEEYRATLAPDRQMLFDRYRPVDVGFKVVGTGSVGTRDYVVLLLGRDENDPLFLQVKEEPPFRLCAVCHCHGYAIPSGAAGGGRPAGAAGAGRICCWAGVRLRGATTWCASSAITRARWNRKSCRASGWPSTAACVPSCWPKDMRAPAIQWL